MWNCMRKNSTVHFETKNETENPESEFLFFLFFLLRTCTWELKHVCCLRCVFHTFVFCIHIYIPFAHVHERRNGMDRERKVIYIHLRGDDEEGEQARKREKRVRRNVCMMCDHINKKKFLHFQSDVECCRGPPREKKRVKCDGREREKKISFLFLLFLFYFFQLALTFTIRRFFIFHVYHTQPTESREGKITAKYVAARRRKKKKKEKRKTYIAHTHTASQTHTT